MPQTLLLADDSITIQRVIALTFADEDIEVVAVGNGDHAIDYIETSPPDIVLADVDMPGRSGYDVARYIKRSGRLAHIPVVLLAGAFEPIDQSQVAEAGCDGVLVKPFEPQQVIDRVKMLLGRNRAGTNGAAVEPGASSPLVAPERADLDQYFERLDRAFAALAEADPAARAPALPGEPAPSVEASSAGLPAGEASFAPEAGSSRPSPERDAPVAPAAEQPEATGPGLSALSRPPSGQTETASWSDAAIDEIARRVIQRMADQSVRESVRDIVLEAAERLVRQEIDRIKSSIT